MTAHPLDRPAWQALTSLHSSLCVGDARAKRYVDDTVPFLSTGSDDPESLASLDGLVREGHMAVILQKPDIALPDAVIAGHAFDAVQMVADRVFPTVSDDRIHRLGPDDAADMLELAMLTKPGPFTIGAQLLGGFWGIRMDGKLVAMAGERMKFDGHTELSGVCTHPDHQGQGLGRLMSEFVAGQICSRGELPFLHAYAGNARAIGLYETIGFRLRTMMHGAILARRDSTQPVTVPH